MQSIRKHVQKSASEILLHESNRIQDMNRISFISKILLFIGILALSALICLSSATSKKSVDQNAQNSPGRYSRGYGYHGTKLGRARVNRARQELIIPPFQVFMLYIYIYIYIYIMDYTLLIYLLNLVNLH